MLFNLLILGSLTDNYGNVWQRKEVDMYMVEYTFQSDKVCKIYVISPN